MQIEQGRIMNDFIEPNKHEYTVPVYQRNYEWSREQCEKLFRDIVQAYQKQIKTKALIDTSANSSYNYISAFKIHFESETRNLLQVKENVCQSL